MRIKFSDDPVQPQKYSGTINSTGAEAILMSNTELQSEVIKLKTDNEILNITLKHLHEEMNLKSEVVRRQNQELSDLRQTVLELQRENQRLKNMAEMQKLNKGEKENFLEIDKLLTPSQKSLKDLNKPEYLSQKNHIALSSKKLFNQPKLDTLNAGSFQTFHQGLDIGPVSGIQEMSQKQLMSFDEEFNKVFNNM